MFLNMLIDHPRSIIPSLRTPVSIDLMLLLPQLAEWHISGISSEVKTFQKKLPHSSSNHGGLKQTSHMTNSLPNCTAGVLNGVSIHFLDLQLMLPISWHSYVLKDTSTAPLISIGLQSHQCMRKLMVIMWVSTH